MNLIFPRVRPTNLIKISRLFHTNCPKLFSKTLVYKQDDDASKSKIKYQDADQNYNHFQVSEPKLKQYIKEETKYNGKLIYVGGLTRQLKSAKILSLTSSAMGIMLFPFLTDSLSASGAFAKLMVFGTTGFFIFVTPLLSLCLSRRYVSRLFYNYEEKKFTAILVSFLMYEYKLEFTIDDVYVPDIPGKCIKNIINKKINSNKYSNRIYRS